MYGDQAAVDDATRRRAVPTMIGRMDEEFWIPSCAPPGDLVRPVPVDPQGLVGPTKRQAAGRRWRRTSRGLYVPADADGSRPEQRALEQAERVRGLGAVTGWAACRLHGARYFDGWHDPGTGSRPLPVPLVVWGPGRPDSDDACVVSQEPVAPAELWRRGGMAVTDPRRALFDEMRRCADLRDAVVAMDMMAAAGVVSLEQMTTYHETHRAWRRASIVPVALGLASERSQSPAEVRMRLVWELDAGLPRPLVNQEIFDRRGRFVAMVDLLDPVAGVVGEYDGAAHRRTARRGRDIGREELLRRLGLEYFDAVAPDLRDRAALADRMRSTRARARFEAPAERAWTIEPPPGWPREPSLDERLFHLEMARCYG